MKIFHLYLLLLLCIGCTDHKQQKTNALNKKIAETPLLSASFDTLLQDVRQLPPRQRIACLLQISYRNEEATDGILKQERILQEALTGASKKEKKKIIQELICIHNRLNRLDIPDSGTKCIRYIDELEKNYPLSQKEKWDYDSIKAYLLNKEGKQEEYLPILFELLKQHRLADRYELVVEDLYAIGNLFEKLGDYKKAISLYKEAYQITIVKNIPALRNKCSIQLIALLCEDGYYREAIDYFQETRNNFFSDTYPPIFNLIAKCYLGVKKPDSARLFLKKRMRNQEKEKIVLNCQMAETYIIEEKTDSAAFYLETAVNAFQSKAKRFQDINNKVSPPSYFLPVYTSYAGLLLKNGKTEEARQAFHFIEPLMKKQQKAPNWIEKQIDALTQFSVFCRITGQYEKALDLITTKDSIQQRYTVLKEKTDSQNLADRFEIQELTHTIEMKDIELKTTYRLNVILLTFGLLFTGIGIIVYLLYRERKKQLSTIYKQQEKIQKFKEAEPELQVSANPLKALFLIAEKKVRLEKLFLNENLSIGLLSEMLDTNRSYLSSCINEFTGSNFNVWINDFRINHAIKLMHKDTSVNPKDIAARCGFTSNETFNRNFKQRCGVKPGEYLNQIIIEQNTKK